MFAWAKGKVMELAEAKLAEPGRKSKTLSAPERDEILSEVLAPIMLDGKRYFAGLADYTKGQGGPFDESDLREISVPLADVPVEDFDGLQAYVNENVLIPGAEATDKLLEDVYGQIRAGRDPSGRRFIDRHNTEKLNADMRSFEVLAADLITSGDVPAGTSPAFLREITKSMRNREGWDETDPIMVNNAIDLTRQFTAEAFNYAIRNEADGSARRDMPDPYKRSIDESIRLYHKLQEEEGLSAPAAREQLGIPMPLSMFTPLGTLSNPNPIDPWKIGPITPNSGPNSSE